MSKGRFDDKDTPVRVLQLVQGQGAYGYVELEIPSMVMDRHAKIVDRSEPDIFAIFVNQMTKKCRDMFGI